VISNFTKGVFSVAYEERWENWVLVVLYGMGRGKRREGVGGEEA
jgi:hypothetical protein